MAAAPPAAAPHVLASLCPAPPLLLAPPRCSTHPLLSAMSDPAAVADAPPPPPLPISDDVAAAAALTPTQKKNRRNRDRKRRRAKEKAAATAVTTMVSGEMNDAEALGDESDGADDDGDASSKASPSMSQSQMVEEGEEKEGEAAAPVELPVERTLALIKPDAMAHVEAILAAIRASPTLHIVRERRVHLSVELTRQFYLEHQERPFYDTLTTWMASQPIHAIELEGPGAVAAWRTMIGPTNSAKARDAAPDSLRARFGTDGSENAVHGSDATASAQREIALVFDYEASSSPQDVTPAAEVAPEAPHVKDEEAPHAHDATDAAEQAIPATQEEEQQPRQEAPDAQGEPLAAEAESMEKEATATDNVSSSAAPMNENVLEDDDDLTQDTPKADAAESADASPVSQDALTDTAAMDDAAAVDGAQEAEEAAHDETKPDDTTDPTSHNTPAAKDEATAQDEAQSEPRQESEAEQDSESAESSSEREEEALAEAEPETTQEQDVASASTHGFVAAAKIHEKPGTPRNGHHSPALSARSSGRSSPRVRGKDQAALGLEHTDEVQRTLAIIKPDAYASGHRATILKRVRNAGFTIVEEKEFKMPKMRAEELYHQHKGKPYFQELALYMSSKPLYAMVLERVDAVAVWRELIGPTSSIKARESAPDSLRARYGKDGLQNGFHGSKDAETALAEIEFVMGRKAKMPRGEGAHSGRASPKTPRVKTPTVTRRRVSVALPTPATAPAPETKGTTAFSTSARLDALAAPRTKADAAKSAAASTTPKKRVMSMTAAPAKSADKPAAAKTTAARRMSTVTSSGYGVRSVKPKAPAGTADTPKPTAFKHVASRVDTGLRKAPAAAKTAKGEDQ